MKELAHRIQISKRLLDIKVEKNISLINSAKIWFYLLQYGMLLLQMFLIYSGYNSFIEQPTELSLLLAYWLIVDEIDDKKSEIVFIFLLSFLLFFIVAVDAGIAYYSYNSPINVYIAFLVGMVSLILIVSVLIFKAIIFGASEIGRVSKIYIEEYRKLQGPKLSKRRFIDNFTVIPFFNKIQKLFHKDKREGNDDL